MRAQERRAGVWKHRVAKYPRLPLRVPVTGEPLDSHGAPLVGESQDLGQGGVLLRLPRGVAPGARVRVTLHLKARDPLALTGSVVWCCLHPDLPGWAVGVAFAEELAEPLFLAIIDEEPPPWERAPWLEEPGPTA